jgi:polygalacturonase
VGRSAQCAARAADPRDLLRPVLPEAKVSALTFDNVKITAKTGMVIYHATGVSFLDGSKITSTSGAAVTIYDAAVTGVTTTAY